MVNDPKSIVSHGYDEIAGLYLEKFGASSIRRKWLDMLIGRLPGGDARILDLGCGAGVPVVRELTEQGHTVVGIDASSEQIARARRNVPKATFIQADMCEVSLETASFDAVCAFYAISHIPFSEQGRLVGNISRWLKPRGTFLASFGTGAPGNWSGAWLGAEMFFANKSRDETLRDIERAGMDVLESSIDSQDDEDTQFLWVVAARRDDLREERR